MYLNFDKMVLSLYHLGPMFDSNLHLQQKKEEWLGFFYQSDSIHLWCMISSIQVEVETFLFNLPFDWLFNHGNSPSWLNLFLYILMSVDLVLIVLYVHLC